MFPSFLDDLKKEISKSKCLGREKILMIGIEGNIGAGKTTEMNYIKKYKEEFEKSLNTKIHLLNEITPSFENMEKFYSDKKKYALDIELEFQKVRLHQLQKEIDSIKDEDNHIIFIDRSIYGNYIFTLNNFFNGNISRENMILINKSLLELETFYKPDIILYLRTDSETCMKRIKARGREYEKNMQINYLISLEKFHDIFFNIDKTTNGVFTIKNKETLVIIDIIKQFISNDKKEKITIFENFEKRDEIYCKGQ